MGECHGKFLIASIVCSTTLYFIWNRTHMKKLNKKERVVNVHWCQKCSHFAHYFLTCKHQKLAMLVLLGLFIFLTMLCKEGASSDLLFTWSKVPSYYKFKQYWRRFGRRGGESCMQLGQIWWHDDKQVQGLFIIKLDYGHLNGDEIKDMQLCLSFVTSINKSGEQKFGQTNIM